jgi:hypothetical protein
MERRREWTEALSSQSLLLCRGCDPSCMTTRTVIESVKSTWTRDDFSITRLIWFGFAKPAFVGTMPYLIADSDS